MHTLHKAHLLRALLLKPRYPTEPTPSSAPRLLSDKGKGCACSSLAASKEKPFLQDTYLRHIPARSRHWSQHCHMPGAVGGVAACSKGRDA